MPNVMSNPSPTGLKELNPYLAAFEEFEEGRGQARARVAPARCAWLGIAYFGELGFPTLKLENWQAHAGGPGPENAARPVVPRSAPVVTLSTAEPFQIPGFSERLVFVNGRFQPGLSRVSPRANGVRIEQPRGRARRGPAAKEQFRPPTPVWTTTRSAR